MTVGQLTLVAFAVFAMGIYTTVRGIVVHAETYRLLQDKKNKTPLRRSITILTMIAFAAALFLEDRIVNDLEIVLPHSYTVVGDAVTAALFGVTILTVINHLKPVSIKRDEKMLFLEIGTIIILSYLILAPTILLFYLKLTTFA